MATEKIQIVIGERGSRTVKRNIAQIGTTARAARSGVQLLKTALGGLGAGIVLAKAVKTLANFSQSMSTISAITGDVGESFTALREKAKQLGIQTRFSATEAADAMIFLSRTGFDANEVMSTIDGTLALAQVGMLGIGRAADIASNVLKGFRLEAESMERVVDVLARTSSSANTDIEQLGSAMSFAAPAAASLGISMEVTAAAIGVLSDAGIQGSRAGAGLRTTLIKMLSPTGEARSVIESLGLKVADLDVNSRGLIPVLETLATKHTQLKEAAKLAGTRQAANLLILIESLPRLKELIGLNEDAIGTARRMATVMDDNLNGALLRVRSAYEGVVIAIGDFGATGFIRGFMEGLASSLRFVADNIENVLEGFRVLAIGFAFTKLKAAITGLIALVVRLNAVILANPFIALATALTVATAALVTFGDEVQLNIGYGTTFADVWEAAGTTLTEDFAAALDTVGIAFIDWGDIGDTVMRALGKSFLFLVGLFKAGLKTISLALDTIILLNKRATLLLVQGLNAMAVAFNSTLARLGAEKIELIDETALEADIVRLKLVLGNAGKAIADAFTAPMREALRLGRQRQIDNFLNRPDERVEKPAKEVVEDAAKKKGGERDLVPKGFKALLRDLEREGELLLQNNKERAVRETLFAAADILAEADMRLSGAQEELLRSLVESNFELAAQRDLLDQINGPADSYAQTLSSLDALLARGAISQEQFTTSLRDARIALLETQTTMEAGFERAFLKMARDSENFARKVEDAITSAFKKAGDALAEFVTTGKLDFSSLINSIIADLARLAIQRAITAPLANALGLGGVGIGGETGGLQGIFNSIFGGAAALTGPGSAGAAAALLPLGPSFAHGGSFVVGGPGGTDRTNVRFNATRGEKVTVETPGQQASGKTVNLTQIWNVESTDSGGFNRNRNQTMNQAAAGASQLAKRF